MRQCESWQSRCRMNLDPYDALRGLRGDLLDVHAARRRGDEGDAPRIAIQQQAEIQLARDVRSRFDVDLADRQALRTGLLGLEALPEHRGRGRHHFLGRPGELDASPLAAAPGVHLCLHHPHRPTQADGCSSGVLRASGYVACGYRDSVPGKKLLGLVFVQIHWEAGGRDEVAYCGQTVRWEQRSAPGGPATRRRSVGRDGFEAGARGSSTTRRRYGARLWESGH